MQREKDRERGMGQMDKNEEEERFYLLENINQERKGE